MPDLMPKPQVRHQVEYLLHFAFLMDYNIITYAIYCCDRRTPFLSNN